MRSTRRLPLLAGRLALAAAARADAAPFVRTPTWSLVLVSLVVLLHGTPSRADFARPAGIYALDSGSQPPSQALMQKPFVDGFVARDGWANNEPSEGMYQFPEIDAALGVLNPLGKRLSVSVRALAVPQYLLDNPLVQTYTTLTSQGEVLTAVPWDPIVLPRWEAFCQALADHLVPAPGGGLVRLADHPLFAIIKAEPIGMNGIRDPQGRLVGQPGYSRAVFIPAVRRCVRAVVERFPGQFHDLAFFTMSDGNPSPPLDRELLDSLRAEFFDGGGPPRLGLFEENLACSTPGTGLAWALFQEQNNTYTTFQMLQSWINPFSNPAQTDPCLVTTVPGDRSTAISGPEVGIEYAYETFSCRYFEVYQTDLLHDGFADEFESWHAILQGTVGVEEGLGAAGLSLSAWPNPSRGEVVFAVEASGPVRLRICDLSGRVVRDLGNPGASGARVVGRWDGRDDDGRRAASGVYLVHAEAAGLGATRKVVLAW